MEQLFSKEKSIPRYSKIGFMYRIPRYDGETHISQEIREEWLEEQALSNTSYSVHSICGELSSVEFIETIFSKPNFKDLCNSYEVIFGPRVESNEIKNKLKKLLQDNSKLKIYSVSKRPENHGFMMDDKIFSEEWHEEGTKYKNATIIERAEEEVKDNFMSYFFNLRSDSTEITLENIDSLEVIEKN